ncbi:Uncharacterised protein [Moraxella caprae]|uniref:Uncharacterized protein n=1 Tax=Moraxella caprae TaxID=90240 RepID=A0A378QW71_9GAMM|nr:Uncharacterised protein [Moraxella caprae]
MSLKVETIEQSTLVSVQPQSTRPKLINFLQQNCNFNLNTIGSSHVNVDNFNDFKNIVFDPNRDYPIVLVSCMNDSGLSFVDCEKLQEHLFGLAQVYFLENNINSYEFESFMGTTKCCAWDGAINIIYPINKYSNISNTLFSRSKLTELDKESSAIFRSILSYVTNYTNIRKKSRHLSPYDVKLEGLKNRRNKLKAEIRNLNFENSSDELVEYKKLANELFEELANAEESFSEKIKQQENSFLEMLSQSEEQVNKLSDENNRLNSRIYQLEYSNSNTIQNKVGDNSIIINLNENDLYNNEIKLFILEAIQNYFNSLPQDDKSTRKYHIFKNLLDCNQGFLSQKDDFFNRLKVEFKGYTKLNKKQRDVLSECNVELKNEISHNTIGFIGDDRYTMTFAKTASDAKAGDNIVRDIKKQLF